VWRNIYPVNPMAVARYRDRHSAAGRKSDHGDAVVLANVLRTDMHAHRPLPAGSELAQAVAVLARAQQDAVWDRTTAHNKLRSHLREYYPGFLAAFAPAKGGIMRPEAQRLRGAFRQPQMRQLPRVEQAMGRQSLALLRQLDAACASAADLEAAATESFNQHPDAEIITSFPGIGALTGARVLAETGDDRSRFTDANGGRWPAVPGAAAYGMVGEVTGGPAGAPESGSAA
jgi:transposase